MLVMFELNVKVYVTREGRVDNWWWSKTPVANFSVCEQSNIKLYSLAVRAADVKAPFKFVKDCR